MAIEQGLAPHFDAWNACNIKMLRDPPHGADQREPPRNALELLDAPNDEATAMDEGAGWITTDIDWSWWFGVAPNDPKHAHEFKIFQVIAYEGAPMNPIGPIMCMIWFATSFPILSFISWIRNDSNVCRTIHCGTSASASGAGRWMLWFMILTLDHTLLPIVLLWFWAAAWNRSEYSIRVRPAEVQCSCPLSVVFRCAMISSV